MITDEAKVSDSHLCKLFIFLCIEQEHESFSFLSFRDGNNGFAQKNDNEKNHNCYQLKAHHSKHILNKRVYLLRSFCRMCTPFLLPIWSIFY